MEQNNSNSNKKLATWSGKLKYPQIWRLPMLSFLNGCLCILMSYFFLTKIARQDFSLRTISIGILTLYALLFHLLARKALREPFHPDILFTVGHLVQFVIPITIFATGLFDDVMYEHIKQVKEYFAKVFGEKSEQQYDRMKGYYGLDRLSRRPVLLEMIIKSLDKIAKDKIAVRPAELYDTFTRIWLGRNDW